MSGIGKGFNVHGLSRVVCDLCGILVKWGSMSEWHKKSVHGLARVVCDHCGILAKWGSMSEWHKKSVHGLARVVCDRCGKLLDGIYRMGRHRRIHKEASC